MSRASLSIAAVLGLLLVVPWFAASAPTVQGGGLLLGLDVVVCIVLAATAVERMTLGWRLFGLAIAAAVFIDTLLEPGRWGVAPFGLPPLVGAAVNALGEFIAIVYLLPVVAAAVIVAWESLRGWWLELRRST